MFDQMTGANSLVDSVVERSQRPVRYDREHCHIRLDPAVHDRCQTNDLKRCCHAYRVFPAHPHRDSGALFARRRRRRELQIRKSRPGGHRTAHFRNCRLGGRFHRCDFGEAVKVRADFAGL